MDINSGYIFIDKWECNNLYSSNQSNKSHNFDIFYRLIHKTINVGRNIKDELTEIITDLANTHAEMHLFHNID